MVDNGSHAPLHRTEWVWRCSLRIRERDTLVKAEDALELSCALWERPNCQAIAPELAADKMFDDDITSL